MFDLQKYQEQMKTDGDSKLLQHILISLSAYLINKPFSGGFKLADSVRG